MYKPAWKLSETLKKWTALCACGLCLGATQRLAAQDGPQDCSAVYDAAREAEHAGELQGALQLYESCAAHSCSSPTQQSCQDRALRLALDAPSVIPLAKHASGEPLVDAQVTMDGALLSARLDGRAIDVDPGLHEFVWSAGGEVFGRQQLLVVQGQRNRELWMSQAPPKTADLQREALTKRSVPSAQQATAPRSAPPKATAASPLDERGGSLLPYVLGGTALLGGGAYALLSSWARDDNQKLARCSPNCSKDSVAHIRSLYTAADISLGVVAAAAIGGITAFLLSGSSSQDKPPAQRSYALTVQPERSGALATFRGTL